MHINFVAQQNEASALTRGGAADIFQRVSKE